MRCLILFLKLVFFLAVCAYLCGDLITERLSTVNERQRQTFAKSLNALIEKVYEFDPDILSQKKKKPDARLPPTSVSHHKSPSPPEKDDEYTEFTPHDGTVQELYEDMQSSAQDDQGLYEESEPSATGGGRGGDEGGNDLYEDPVPGNQGSSSTVQQQPESEQHEVETPYTETKVRHSASRDSMVSMDIGWEAMYDVTVKPTDKKVKVSELKNITCKGMLEKLGGAKGKTWQKRFCVLSEAYMCFYESETSKGFKNRVLVPLYTTSLAPEHTNTKEKHFSFKLSCQSPSGKKDYHFRTKTEDDRTKWVNALKEIDSSHAPTQSSTSTMRAAPTQPEVISKLNKRSASVGDICEVEEEEYQDMITEETQEDYEVVEPGKAAEEEHAPIEELTESMEEYVDVQPGLDPAEDYEDPNMKVEPPKPLPKAPQPSRPPITASRSNGGGHPLPDKPQVPAPLPDVAVDTNKIHTQPPEGVQYKKVYALLWDFVTSEKDEVSLKRGDLVYVQDPKPGADWWLGELLDPDVTFKVGKKGYFPTSYVAEAFEVVA